MMFAGNMNDLACFSASLIEIWDLSASRKMFSANATPPDFFQHFALSSDGKSLAVEMKSGSVKLLDTSNATASPADLSSARTFAGTRPALSPDGKQLATIVGKAIKIWDLEGSELRTFTPPGPKEEAVAGSGVPFVAFSADGTRLAASAGSRAEVWEIASGRNLLDVPIPSNNPEYLAFSPNGKLLASGGAGPVRIWEVSSGVEPVVEPPNLSYSTPVGGSISRVLFSPGSTKLAVNVTPINNRTVQTCILRSLSNSTFGRSHCIC
jgi:WD40 repeat protein